MYSCLVIDDDQYAIDSLSGCIEKTPNLVISGKFTNPIQALEFIDRNPAPDIVFLDINMPELSGFSVAESLPETTAVIFTTGYIEHALPAFSFTIVDFLLKPFSFAKFQRSVEKITTLLDKTAKATSSRSREYFFIGTGVKGTVMQLKFSDIQYVKALDNYIVIHTLNGNHITYLTMTELENSLSTTHFARIHRSYIVNMDQVKIIQGNEIILLNDLKLPLGYSHREHILARIQPSTLKTGRR